MTIQLRKAVVADAPVLEEIEQRCFPRPNWDGSGILRYECTVAEVEGRIAGFLVTRELVPSEREILNLAVLPEFRHRGVASSLLTEELQRPATHYLEVRESNTAAQALYRKFGFEAVGQRKGYYEHPVESGIVMRMK